MQIIFILMIIITYHGKAGRMKDDYANAVNNEWENEMTNSEVASSNFETYHLLIQT